MEPCIEVSNIYGKDTVIQMTVDSSACTVDPTPFFAGLFEQRDELFGGPDFSRRESRGSLTTFNFRKPEFIEAFLGTYSPAELARFLSRKMDTELGLEDAFTEFIETAEQEYRLAFPVYCPWHNTSRPSLFPINFPIEELDKAIPKNLLSRNDGGTMYYRYRIEGLRNDLREREFRGSKLLKSDTLSMIRKIFLELEKPIIIVQKFDGPERPHDIDIVCFYDLPREGLRLVRAEQKE
jgi:hypothetical protein